MDTNNTESLVVVNPLDADEALISEVVDVEFSRQLEVLYVEECRLRSMEFAFRIIGGARR